MSDGQQQVDFRAFREIMKELAPFSRLNGRTI